MYEASERMKLWTLWMCRNDAENMIENCKMNERNLIKKEYIFDLQKAVRTLAIWVKRA